MKLTNIIRQLFLILSISFSYYAHSQDLDIEQLKDIWINQNGSILQIEEINSETGEITGKFQSFSGAGSNYYLIKGWANIKKDKNKEKHYVIALSFSTNWGKYGSITSWTGFLERKNNQLELYTQWTLTRSEAHTNWEHLLTGSDVFHLKNKSSK